MGGDGSKEAGGGWGWVPGSSRMDLTKLSDRERLIAEQAVLAFRESIKAMEGAPHGAGMGKGDLTIGARRLACLAASSWSFDKASENLSEFCGLSISDQTIRRVADEEGSKAFDWMDTAYAATTKFTRAGGQTEFSGDG